MSALPPKAMRRSKITLLNHLVSGGSAGLAHLPGVGEGYDCDCASSYQNRNNISIGDPGNCKGRQSLRKWAQDRHISALGQTKRCDDGCCTNHPYQYARQAFAVLKQ